MNERAERKKLLKKRDEILVAIREGEIKEYEYENIVPPEIDMLISDAELRNAFRYYYNLANYKHKYEHKKSFPYCPSGNIYLFQGDSSSFIRELAKNFCKSKGYNYYIAHSGSNPFYEYKGQEAIIFDNGFNDISNTYYFLKVLDNNNWNEFRRYRLRKLGCVKMVIIVNYTDNIPFDKNDELKLIFPRIKHISTLHDVNSDGIRYFDFKEWNRELKDYELTDRYIVRENGKSELQNK